MKPNKCIWSVQNTLMVENWSTSFMPPLCQRGMFSVINGLFLPFAGIEIITLIAWLILLSASHEFTRSHKQPDFFRWLGLTVSRQRQHVTHSKRANFGIKWSLTGFRIFKEILLPLYCLVMERFKPWILIWLMFFRGRFHVLEMGWSSAWQTVCGCTGAV